jgi:uncharacterized protein YqgC (DUF456 family)
VAFILSAALIFSGMLLSGCGSAEEEAQEPAQQEDAPIEITADEVPVVREGEDPEAPAEQADAEAEDAEEQQPPAEEAEEAPAEAEGATPPTAEPEASADDEQPGLLSKIGGALKTVGVVVGKLLFVLILPAAIAGTLVGMPGGILVLADATIFSAFHGWAVPPWWVLLILVVIAVLAEVAENLLSFTGVKRSGASNTTGVWVMVGGFAGAMLGGAIAPVFSGIGALAGPVGWVILSVIPPIGLGMLGGFLGGYYFEIKRGKDPEEAKKAGWGALTGRLAGSFTKAMLVAVMAAIVLISTWGALF